MPLSFGVLTTGNMTNSFAQSAAVLALVIMAWPFAAGGGMRLALSLCAALLVAFLSHTGTLATLFVSAVCIAALYVARGGPEVKRAGVAIGVATLIAGVVAVAVYYAHFVPTYRAEFARIGHETATAARDAGGRTIGDRLRLVPYSLDIYIGVPALLFAALGGVVLARRPTGDRLTLALGGWMLACAVFLALGLLTPVDMRYYLAALPAIAVAAGFGAASAWQGEWATPRRWWRLAAAVILAAMVSTGFHAWWSALG
jgi:hypothetical protein